MHTLQHLPCLARLSLGSTLQQISSHFQEAFEKIQDLQKERDRNIYI